MTGASDAVARVLAALGARALAEPRIFRSALADMGDREATEVRLLVMYADEGVLAPFARAASTRDAALIGDAARQGASRIARERLVDPALAASACDALARGVAVWAGVTWQPAGDAGRSGGGVRSSGSANSGATATGAATGSKPRTNPASSTRTRTNPRPRDPNAPVPIHQVHVVLYADGELVFQGDDSRDPGRPVLHAGLGGQGRQWWTGEWSSDSHTVVGRWCQAVHRVSSRCPVVASGKLDGLFQYCTALSDVSGLALWDVSRVTSLRDAFYGCWNLANLQPLAGWDVSHVMSMNRTFCVCRSIVSFNPIRAWHTPSLADLGCAFLGCESLLEVSALSAWDVSHVTNMADTFHLCTALADVSGISGWDVSQARRMDHLFEDCPRLKSVKPLRRWKVGAGCTMTDAFKNCPAKPPKWYRAG